MFSESDVYLLKLKQAGKTDAFIAAKVGCLEAEVQTRLLNLQKISEQRMSNGYFSLVDRFTLLCNNYQALGEAMKSIAAGLGAVMSLKELSELLKKAGLKEEECDKAAEALLRSAIVLHPYVEEVPPNASGPEIN